MGVARSAQCGLGGHAHLVVTNPYVALPGREHASAVQPQWVDPVRDHAQLALVNGMARFSRVPSPSLARV